MLGKSLGDCDVATSRRRSESPSESPSRTAHFDLVKFYQVRTSYRYILVYTKDIPVYTGIYQSVQYIPVYTVLIPVYSSLYTVYSGIYQVSAEFSGYVVLYFLTIFILSYSELC